ncbi:hypothetical protein PYW08_015105 [Mythimna loreyi]|uniref:Uncharacterized protein n=1 Tax=Mythimna loreyi TaxID=667449 RepID=A0ACC2QXD6_9NEOP|nr:hypothetical protein PYW08_015105 [Mythimna loreyi]
MISPPSNMSPAITFRNIKRKRSDDEENCLSTFMTDLRVMFNDLKQQQEDKYNMLFSKMDELRLTFDMMSEKLNNLTSRVEHLESERGESMSYIATLETKIENMEQGSRSTCLEIRNIPVEKTENKTTLLKTVLHTSKIIKCEMNSYDIKDIFRIKSKDPAHKTMIVNFTTVLRKEEFLEKYRKHNMNSFKLTTEHLKIGGPAKPIFISENLSSRNKRLFFLARGVANTNNYKFCWVKHGKIFVREKEGSKHIHVKTEADLSLLAKTII